MKFTICFRILSLLLTAFLANTLNYYAVTTFTGDGQGFNSFHDGNPARIAWSYKPQSIFGDTMGNIYSCEGSTRIRRYRADGSNTSTMAFASCTDLWVDTVRSLYATVSNTILKVDLVTSVSSTYLGGFGTAGGIHGDTAGNLYVVDTQRCVVYKVTPALTTSIMLGTSGSCSYATTVNIKGTSTTIAVGRDVWVDTIGQLYVMYGYYFAKVNTSGYVTSTINPGLTSSYYMSGDGTYLYAPDTNSDGVYRVSLSSFITGAYTTPSLSRFVGASYSHYPLCSDTGDGGPPTAAKLCQPYGTFIDSNQVLYIADTSNDRIRRIDLTNSSKIIYPFSGVGRITYFGDGLGASNALFSYPTGIALDPTTNDFYISDFTNYRIRKIQASTNIITTFVGTGINDNTGDGGTASNAKIYNTQDVFVDTAGSFLYFADTGNCKVRRVNLQSNIISTFVGSGSCTASGSGAAVSSVGLDNPRSIWCHPLTAICYVGSQSYIWQVSGGTGTIIAGNGGTSAASGNALSTGISGAYSVRGDTNGNLYYTDFSNAFVRQIVLGSPNIVSTIVSSASQAYGLYLDTVNNQLIYTRQTTCTVNAYSLSTLTTSVIAGTGSCYALYSGDNPFATAVGIHTAPFYVTGDSNGNIYFSEGNTYGSRVRRLSPFFYPTGQPSRQPTSRPTRQPTGQPSRQPISLPTGQPSMQPSRQPTAQPSRMPTNQPTTQPSARPTGQPSRQPTSQPISRPSSQPSSQPTSRPTIPTSQPTGQPSSQPIGSPSSAPSGQPSTQPSRRPSAQPSSIPSSQPTQQPTSCPTSQPSSVPSVIPSSQPSSKPSAQPTVQPSSQPSGEPTRSPSGYPSSQPSGRPSGQPSCVPSVRPSMLPSSVPSSLPTIVPSGQPSRLPTSQPTVRPSSMPSMQPTSKPSVQPSALPSSIPSGQPSMLPSGQPTVVPSGQPTTRPSGRPTSVPSTQPSGIPTRVPSGQPSVVPSCQPSRMPSTQPTTKPTGQPTVFPSTQPSAPPSGQPSAQPTRSPSGQPTSQPSSAPSAQPTAAPSRRPATQPTGQPSRQPSSRPSTTPSAQPSNQPSVRPSNQPSSKPTSQPSESPTRRPSSQPTETPSGQPSRIPSSHPSRFPSSAPSTVPTANPTADKQKCFNSTYYLAEIDHCQTCPAHSTNQVKGATTCTCKGGYSPEGAGKTLVCDVCDIGQYSQAGDRNCSSCPIGTYSDTTGVTSCTPCALNFYNPEIGQSKCLLCPNGRTTASTGSSGLIQCISPIPNFTLGFFALLTVIIIFSWYIVFGRFHRLSFERRNKIVLPIIDKCKKILYFIQRNSKNKLEELKLASSAQSVKSFRLQTIPNKAAENNSSTTIITSGPSQVQRASAHTLRRYRASWENLRYLWRICSFLLTCLAVMFLYIICYYVVLTYQVFFTSLILYRGMHVTFPSLSPILVVLSQGLKELSSYLGLPYHLGYYLAAPFLYLFDALASLHVNLSSVNVTCSGSQAPIELFINCAILGLVIIFIRSDYQILFNILISSLSRNYMSNVVERQIDNIHRPSSTRVSSSTTSLYSRLRSLFGVCGNHLFFLCILISSLNAMNPFQVAIRYAMGFINLASFVANHNLAHNVSPSCNNVPSAPNFDSFLGYTSSVFAWWLILPTIYCLAEVIVLKTINLPKNPAQTSVGVPSSPMGSTKRSLIKVNPAPSSSSGRAASSEKSFSIKLEKINEDEADSETEKKSGHPEDDEEKVQLELNKFLEEAQQKNAISPRALLALRAMGTLSLKIHDESQIIQQKEEEEEDDQAQREKELAQKKVSYRRAMWTYFREWYSFLTSVDMWISKLVSLWVNALMRNTVVEVKQTKRMSIISLFRNEGDPLEEEEKKEEAGRLKLQQFADRQAAVRPAQAVASPSSSPRPPSFLLHRTRSALAITRHRSQKVFQDLADYDQKKLSERQQMDKLWEENDEHADSSVVLPTSASFKSNRSSLTSSNKNASGKFKKEDNAENRLPSYYALCMKVKEELHDTYVAEPMATIFAFFGVGHFCTKVGLLYWKIVFNNYKIFFLAAVGIWTDESTEAYDLKNLSQRITIHSNPAVLLSHHKRVTRIEQDKMDFKRQEELRNQQDTILMLIQVLLTSRVILFQIIPSMVIISTFTLVLASYPLFIRSIYLQDSLPPFIIWKEELRKRAMEKELFKLNISSFQEQRTAIRTIETNYQWRLCIRSMVLFWTESRCFQLLCALIILLLSFLFLVYTPNLLICIVILLGLLLPFVLAKSMELVLYCGRLINLTDDDLFFCSRLFKRPYHPEKEQGNKEDEEESDDASSDVSSDDTVEKDTAESKEEIETIVPGKSLDAMSRKSSQRSSKRKLADSGGEEEEKREVLTDQDHHVISIRSDDNDSDDEISEIDEQCQSLKENPAAVPDTSDSEGSLDEWFSDWEVSEKNDDEDDHAETEWKPNDDDNADASVYEIFSDRDEENDNNEVNEEEELSFLLQLFDGQPSSTSQQKEEQGRVEPPNIV